MKNKTKHEIREEIKELIRQANTIVGNANLDWVDENVLKVANMIQVETHYQNRIGCDEFYETMKRAFYDEKGNIKLSIDPKGF